MFRLFKQTLPPTLAPSEQWTHRVTAPSRAVSHQPFGDTTHASKRASPAFEVIQREAQRKARRLCEK